MGIKAASCPQFQTRGMIFWDDTGDKNYVIRLPSLNWKCMLSWHFVILVMEVGSEGFCKHLLKCGYFYNLSNTTLEGGRSAYFIIVAKPCYWMTAFQDHRAPRILLDLVVQTGQWSFILCCCLMHYITNALVKTVVCKSLEASHKWLTHCLPHSEILLQVTAFVLLI